MEVVMFPNHFVAARIVTYYQAEMLARARREHRNRNAASLWRMAKLKAPPRLPRYWRWLYL